MKKPSSVTKVGISVAAGDVVGEDVSGSKVIAGTISSISSIKTRAIVGFGVGVDVVGMLSDMLRELRSRGTPMKGSKLSVSLLMVPPLKFEECEEEC